MEVCLFSVLFKCVRYVLEYYGILFYKLLIISDMCFVVLD